MGFFDKIFKGRTSNVQKTMDYGKEVLKGLEESRNIEEQEKNKESEIVQEIEKTGSKLFDEIIRKYLEEYASTVDKKNAEIKGTVEYIIDYLEKHDNGRNTTNSKLKKYYDINVDEIINRNIKDVFYANIISFLNDKQTNFHNQQKEKRNAKKDSDEYLKELLDEVIDCMNSNKEKNGICSVEEWQKMINDLTAYDKQLEDIIKEKAINEIVGASKSLNFAMNFTSAGKPGSVVQNIGRYVTLFSSDKEQVEKKVQELEIEEIKRNLAKKREEEKGKNGYVFDPNYKQEEDSKDKTPESTGLHR